MKESNNYKIAIVIPAYKQEFFHETLDSLFKQTDKNFRVYIGDDNSPNDIISIVEQYTDKLDIVYKRFDENLGRTNLVAHWNRCMDMLEDEEWFILFSDDDILEPDCIKSLRKEMQITDHDVYHFNLKIIDKQSNLLNTPPSFPQNLSSLEFFRLLYSYKIDARMPEFIFRLSHFKEKGGFIPFENAMGSDNATVMNCANKKGIHTINDGYVLWRNSGMNVSARTESKTVNIKNLKALVHFFNWVRRFCRKNKEKHPFIVKQRIAFLLVQREEKAKYIGEFKAWTIIFCSKDINHNWFLLRSINRKKNRICDRMRD